MHLLNYLSFFPLKQFTFFSGQEETNQQKKKKQKTRKIKISTTKKSIKNGLQNIITGKTDLIMLASRLRSQSAWWLAGNLSSSRRAWYTNGGSGRVQGAWHNIGGSGGMQGAVEETLGRWGRRASSNNVDTFRDTATLRLPNGAKVRKEGEEEGSGTRLI